MYTQNASQDRYLAALTTLPKNYLEILERYQQDPENQKKIPFEKNEFSSECSCGHVEGTLYTPAGILLPDIIELYPQSPKKWRNIFFTNFFQRSHQDT